MRPRSRVKASAAALVVPVVLLAAPLTAPATAEPAPPAPAPAAELGGTADDVGTWSVTPDGAGGWTVEWRAPSRLPLSSDRPTIVASEAFASVAEGAAIGVPLVEDDGRTVTTTVVSTTPPDPAALDVVLSGETLDEPAPVPAPPAPGRWSEPVRDLLGDDPATPGDLPVVASDYELDGMTWPSYDKGVEMVGHVVEPAPEAADPSHPLVLFLHGRHSYCYNPAKDKLTWAWPCKASQEPVPSQLGYDYIQRVLASQGFVTVSIAANGINAQDWADEDGGAAARSRLVQAHLDQWAAWAGDTHQVDLDRVVLVGHSRGGEGVARASLEIPLDAPYRVAGQVLLAPTDFSRQTSPFVPTATMLPYCDGDVIDLQGQAYTDVSRGLAADDTSLKSSVMVMGANHNFFNTEWTPGISAAPSNDDWWESRGVCGKGSETRLKAKQQRRVGTAYVAGAARLFARGETQFAPMYDGSAVRVESTGPAVVLSHALGGGRELRAFDRDTVLTEPAGAVTQVCLGVTGGADKKRQCGRVDGDSVNTPHWPSAGSLVPTQSAFEMAWSQVDARGGVRLEQPLDLTGMTSLDLRTVVDIDLGDVDVDVRVTDGSGASVDVTPVGDGAVPALPRGPRWFGKYWAQTLRVDVVDLVGVDLTDVVAVELLGRSPDGRVFVLDVAGSPDALPAVPARRLPLVDLGRARVPEGDDPAGTAEVPFTVTGAVEEAGSFHVAGYDEQTGGKRRLLVPVTPGMTSGTVPWPLDGDDLDDYNRRFVQLVAHAAENVMVRDSSGRLVIVDDDPSPTVRIRAVRTRIEEGGSASWRVRLSAPVSYPVSVVGQVLADTDTLTPLVAADLPRRWQSRHVWCERSGAPLHECSVEMWAVIEPGERTATLSLPTRDDALTEPRESVRIKVRTFRPVAGSTTSTVVVAASD